MLQGKLSYVVGKYAYCTWRAECLVADFGYTYEKGYRIAEQEWNYYTR